MTVYLGIAAIVMIAGLLMYLLMSHAKYSEVGRLMFFAGMFVLLLHGDVLLK